MDKKTKAFLIVLNDHKGIIYKVANTYCFDKADQDDLIQEIILQMWRSIDSYDSKYKWSTWIYRIALNTSISYYRKNKVRKERTESLSIIIDTPAIDQEDSEGTHSILLRKFIKELKEIDRALILLYLEGFSSKEIATIINTSQSNVTTKISRIKGTLIRKFDTLNIKNHG